MLHMSLFSYSEKWHTVCRSLCDTPLPSTRLGSKATCAHFFFPSYFHFSLPHQLFQKELFPFSLCHMNAYLRIYFWVTQTESDVSKNSRFCTEVTRDILNIFWSPAMTLYFHPFFSVYNFALHRHHCSVLDVQKNWEDSTEFFHMSHIQFALSLTFYVSMVHL